MKRRQILYTIPFVGVWFLTLLLLIYIGYGESRRTYYSFQMEKLQTQGEIMQIAISAYLQAGLPLKQFSGFASQSEGLLRSDDRIENIQVLDPAEKRIFIGLQSSLEAEQALALIDSRTYGESRIQLKSETFARTRIEESADSFRLVLDLRGKFGVAGFLILESTKKAVYRDFNRVYRYVFYGFIALSVVFILFILLFEILRKTDTRRRLVYQVVYTVGFLLMSLIIAAAVFNIYGEGARAKTQVLSDYLAKRLEAVAELGIEFEDISGINEALRDIKASDADVKSIALIQDGRALYHTEQRMIGKTYTPDSRSYEHFTSLKAGFGGSAEVKVLVSIPLDIVTRAILGSAKNFIVLFIACSLIALIFLDVSTQLVSSAGRAGGTSVRGVPPRVSIDGASSPSFRLRLSIIRPAYFLIVFVSALSVSFLPRLVAELMSSTTSPIASLSLPFTIYYAFFAMVLVPAGHYAESGSLKRLMVLGFMSEVVGLFLVAITDSYWVLSLGRAVSGIGQGVFLIGLQSYLLAVTPENRRTEGAAVKVIGRNSALIVGSAIGALLYVYLDYQKLFFIGSMLSVVGLVYLLILVPNAQAFAPDAQATAGKRERRSIKRIFRNVVFALRDREFVKSLAFVGLIAKMSITGVVLFALPLIMARMNYAKEDIGQAIMLYYIASMLVSRYAAKMVDRLDATKIVLFLSNLVGGIGMFVLGLIGVGQLADQTRLPVVPGLNRLALIFNNLMGTGTLKILVLLLCLILAGASNGLMAAPILTHITKTKAAKRYGNKSMTATYVFLERIGHVVGPMFVSFLFLLSDQSNTAISLFGAITIVLGLIFLVTAKDIKTE
ncbi:MAG: MFS transporter [Spirochaetaceae bacterium]|nr:MAG: MFS transporter [Spirochaetaceae bacterium]